MTKIDIFELYNMLNFRPQVAKESFGPEPSLQDMILKYYKSFPDLITDEEATELTVKYIEQFYKKYG